MKKYLVFFVLLIALSLSLFPEPLINVKELEKKLIETTGKERIPILVKLAKHYMEKVPLETTRYGQEGLELMKKYPPQPEQYVDLLNYIGKATIRQGNYKNALKYAKKARKLAEKINYETGIAEAIFNIAWLCEKESKMSQALEHYAIVENIYTQLGLRKKKAHVKANIANLYSFIGEHSRALDYLFNAKKILEESGDKTTASKLLNSIGAVYMDLKDYDKALDYLLKAKKAFNKDNNEFALAPIYDNAGWIYYEQGKFEQALQEYDLSIKLKKKLGNTVGVAFSLTNVGMVWEKKKDHEKALEFYTQARRIFTETNSGMGFVITLISIGRIHRKAGRSKNALECLLPAMKEAIAKSLKAEELAAYEELSELYNAMGNYRIALDFHLKFKKLNDSIFDEANSKRIAGMQAYYHTEKKEKEITLLKKNKELQQLALEKQTNLKNSFFVASLLIMILAFVLQTRYRLKTKQEKEINRQKRELEAQAEKLASSNKELEKLSIIARETDNAMVIMDAEGNHQWANEGFARFYGMTIRQLILKKGKNIVDTSSNPNIKALLRTCIDEAREIQYESHVIAASGEDRYAQTTLTPILDKEGNLSKLVAIDSDITNLKRSEEEIQKKTDELKKANAIVTREREIAETANRSKSEFLARMSHEIRTPMNGVIGFAEMLIESGLNEEQQDYVDTITCSGEALLALLNDILDFSKIEAGELTFESIVFDPEVIAFDVCEITRPRIAAKPIELLCRIDDNVPALVLSDPGRFRQVLVNLMSNAAKFTASGEIELALNVENEEKNHIKLHVQVRDTGIGIPAEKIDVIFDVFQQADGSVTRKYGGSGLGLSISKQIAKLMGGDVRGESEPGKGSTFHYTARVRQAGQTGSDKIDSAKTGIAGNGDVVNLEGKKILLLDDNQSNLNILTHILKAANMEVVPLSNPLEAASLIEAQAAATPFDICIIDIAMPGKSGYDVAKEIRQLGPAFAALPLLAFSSSTMQRSKQYKDAGFDGFLLKPARKKKLLTMLEYLLTNPPGQREKVPLNGTAAQGTGLVTKHTLENQTKHSIHILLAEDNPINKKLARYMLEKAGYQVTIVNNGEEAVKMITTQTPVTPEGVVTGRKFQLIFMDIQMPIKDGRQASREIRAAGFTGIPIIAITAEAMKGDREKCLDAGMNDYITKPLKRDKVYEMVKKWCLDKR
ncbi:MAG: response regulator [bacterium]|nr:response regulator [bacterium]